ncbi:MAG: aminotransferase [Acidimicrobiaceae bacterium]|nr:aminotransferase [Acidimicrobiaceae bacterium]MBA4809883.1 pyridoxal phosphate-dependent aminotransferase [Acidimicrobiales bacterium]
MSALAIETGAINLGQGFPDTDGPIEISELAIQAIRNGQNQYPPGLGIPELRKAISAHQKRFYNLDFDFDTEVLVTAGATEGIAASLLALCKPGDEVITFEPYYDSYAASIALSGATRRVVTLRTPNYQFDPEELRNSVNANTKAILVNSPHNPTGKVFSKEELLLISELCQEHDLIAICDEVYEHLVFEGVHTPLISLPGMRDRTIQISSSGKTFSFTGWKIGWVCAQPALLNTVRTAKQFLTYVNGSPFQPAIASALLLPDDYFRDLLIDMKRKRDCLSNGLENAGFTVFVPAGTYFVTADIRPLGISDGREFCLTLPQTCGVVAVPNVVFYDNKDEGRHLVRFAFCKRLEVLESAVLRLMSLKDSK